MGLLLNLKSNDKTKNIITLQVFVDRSDLKKSPTPKVNPDEDDWRFGFKVGLPINLKSGI